MPAAGFTLDLLLAAGPGPAAVPGPAAAPGPAAGAAPGAPEALAAARAAGRRTVLLTAADAGAAATRLAAARLSVDRVIAGLAPAAGAAALLAAGAEFLAATTGEVTAAARAAGLLTVGPGAGLDVPLDGLAELPEWLVEHDRVRSVQRRLAGLGSALVAFSGGADSAFLLALAAATLGPERVAAATAVSPSLAGAELRAAREFAAELGVRHFTPGTAEGDDPRYQRNDASRCFWCKSELLDALAPLAAAEGLAAVLTGTNADDARDPHRPGIRAAAERGALTPLADAGLTKAQVRAASRRRGLSTWDKPAAPCLASRLRTGVTVTAARLARVERAEAGLRAALAAAGVAVRDLRVRDLGDRARVEVDREAVGALSPAVLAAVRGWAAVEVAPDGFRSGALHDIAPLAQTAPSPR